MTCSPLLLPSSLYLNVMSSITSLLLFSASVFHNKHTRTLSLAVLQIFFWFIDSMIDFCSFCLIIAPSSYVVFWISPFKQNFFWYSCLLLYVQCIEWGHAPTTMSYLWFFNVSSTITPTLTLSNVSLQHYYASNSLHFNLHWTPFLLLIFTYFSMSHTLYNTTSCSYIYL